LERATNSATVAGNQQVHGLAAKSLDDLLVGCIEETLLDLVGSRAGEAIYDYLERGHSLSRGEIPNHLNIFLSLLEETFGKGSKTIDRAIIKRLYAKLELKFESKPQFEFMDYLEAVRAMSARSREERSRVKVESLSTD